MGYILLLSYMDGAFQQALEGIFFFEYCQTLSNIASMSGSDASDCNVQGDIVRDLRYPQRQQSHWKCEGAV